MSVITGTYTLSDLREVDETVINFGEEALGAALEAERQAHNRRYLDMVGSFMSLTSEREVNYGMNADSGELLELNEESRSPTRKKEEAAGVFNLPLKLYGDAVGWTRDYFLKTSVRDVANEMTTIENRDIKTLYRITREALFRSTNYETRDFLVEGKKLLYIKRLVNADGMTIPNSPEGQSFDPDTHTHYIGATSWNEANATPAIDAAINTVREHGHTGNVRLVINATNITNIKGLSKFEALKAPLLEYGNSETRAAGTLDNSQPEDNRFIGVWDGLYQVWTKPWQPAGYGYVYDTQGPRTLQMRQPAEPILRGLRFVATVDAHPWRVNEYQHRMGVGVAERTNGAAIDFTSGTYSDPL